MAINLASKYSTKISERFKLASKTDDACGHDYEFTGVNAITIYSIDTVPTSDYNRNGGTTRFGEDLADLGDTTQTLTMGQDKAFHFSIDAGNASEQFNIKHANKCLKREWDEVCTPEIDKYRLNAWATGRGLTVGNTVLSKPTADGTLDETNIVEAIFEGGALMSDKLVPETNRTIFIPELSYVKFEISKYVMGGNQLNGETIRRGYKGTINGMRVVTVPTGYLPSNLNFMIKYKGTTVDPMKLKNLRVHKNPMGVDGDVVEGRYMYDSFVLDNKRNGIYLSKRT